MSPTFNSVYDKYEVVIGLEVHCQLLTQSKIFSPASTQFGSMPNTQVSEVDLGLPGVLPVLNRQVVEYAVRAGLALNCRVNTWNQIARKNYFYPDLPKGYQISQHDTPICEHGFIDIELEDQTKRIGITRIHMEEDAGKSSHPENSPYSIVDLNRAGVPLIEIVSEPELRSADEVVAYLKELRNIVVYLGICDGNMEEGSLRCDANVSVRLKGAEKLGTRAELKNINSFKFIKEAIQYEVTRQIDILEMGGTVIQETRLYNVAKGETFAMRSKEESHDYRYFPEPDLPAVVIESQWLEQIREGLPELPAQKRERYQDVLELSARDAKILCAEPETARYFEAALQSYSKNPKVLANWILNELLREVKGDTTLDTIAVRPVAMARLVELIDTKVISGKIAKEVFEHMVQSGDGPDAIVEAKGLKQVSDEGAIGKVIDELMANNPEQVASFQAGEAKLIGWFVGQVMKQMRGKANPQVVNELLRQKLNG